MNLGLSLRGAIAPKRKRWEKRIQYRAQAAGRRPEPAPARPRQPAANEATPAAEPEQPVAKPVPAGP